MTKLPPGPQIPGLLQTLGLLLDPIATLDRAIADYGDTFTLRVLGLGSPPVVFFSNPESIQAIFTTLAGSFDLGKVTHVFQPLVGDRSLIMEQGDRHRHQRQLLMPALHGEQLQGYGEAIVARTQDWLATQGPGQPIAIRREMAELSLDVILRVVFGLVPGPRYGELRGLLAEMLEAITSSAYSLQFFLPQLQQNLGPWSPWGGFVALRSRINALIYAEIADRKANPQGQDVLAMLVAAVDETGAGLTDDEIRDQLMTLLLLGHETTASALTWAFYWLTQSPDSLTRLRSELADLDLADVTPPNPTPPPTALLPTPLLPSPMDRRKLLQTLGQGAGVAALTACSRKDATPTSAALPAINWQMATSWPVSLDTIFGGAQVFADRVAAMTGGQFKISPRAAGEIAPGTEVLNVVSQGAVPCGHSAGYYYVGKSPAVAFGTSLPFGLNAQQQNAWLYDGGGLTLLQALYAKKFNVIQFPCGNTGAQMGGWFRKEITSIADLKGLKMRIPGLGGKVMAKLGVTVQTLPGGEIFQALQTGAIDAAEWVGPYDDEKLGLNRVAKYYYSPGWWEPGPTLELQINLNEWKKLPVVYQEIIKSAAAESNLTMLARYDARNNEALQRLKATGVQLRSYSPEILAAAEKAAFALYDEFAAQDADFKTIYDSWKGFRDRVYAWNNLNEASFANYSYSTLK